MADYTVSLIETAKLKESRLLGKVKTPFKEGVFVKASESTKGSFNRSVLENIKLQETKDIPSVRIAKEKISLQETKKTVVTSSRITPEITEAADTLTPTPVYSSDTVRMIYGGYEFKPVPLLSVGRELIRDGSGNKLFERTTISCNGALVLTGGALGFDKLTDQQFKQLKAALSTDRERLTITHGNGYFVNDVYPRVENFKTEEGIWVNKIRFTFDLVYETVAASEKAVESFTDSWDWNENEEGRVEVSHSLSARGFNTSSVYGGNNSLQNAKEFLTPRLGISNIPSTFPGQIKSIYGEQHLTTYIRRLYTEAVDKEQGSYSITENFILDPEDNATYTQTRTFEYSLDEEGTTTISLTGSVLGQGDNSTTRDSNALAGWKIIEGALFVDSNDFYEEIGGDGTLGSSTLSKSITRNKKAGTIDYSVSFSDKIGDENAIDIIDSSFEIEKKNPIPQYASIGIPGKVNGPVWQDLGTISEGSYTISGTIRGKTMDAAVNYAQYLINTNSGQFIGTSSRIVDYSFKKQVENNTVNFSISWAFIGTETTQLLN